MKPADAPPPPRRLAAREVIVTHANADFDALASKVAASRVYPGAVMVRGKTVSRGVRDFLALHKDRFEQVPVEDLDLDAVERVIIVDVRRASRLRDYGPLLERMRDPPPGFEVHVYDHHGPSADDVQATHEVVEPIGSATTLLVERLRERGAALDSVEATLLALGIHADTGSLTFPSATARDADAVAWLMGLGARTEVVQRYLREPFSGEHLEVLVEVLRQVRTLTCGHVPIGLAAIALPERVDRLAEVVSHALSLLGHAAVIGVFGYGERVQAIGRSQVPWVDIGELMQAMGGGGHAGAGSALLKKVTVDEVRARLVAWFEEHPPRPSRVRDVMTRVVQTCEADLPLEQAGRMLEGLGVSGLPVLKDGALVGVISRRDVAAAGKDGRLHLPVSSCMAHPVVTADCGDTLEEALDKMVDKDIGRLPVVEGGRLQGILSRTDLLRFLYPPPEPPPDET